VGENGCTLGAVVWSRSAMVFSADDDLVEIGVVSVGCYEQFHVFEIYCIEANIRQLKFGIKVGVFEFMKDSLQSYALNIAECLWCKN